MQRMATVLASILALAHAVAAAETTAPAFAAVFQDHAILQRDAPLRIWGTAPPRADLILSLDARRVPLRADGSGRWETTLDAVAAGGPHVLELRDGRGAGQRIEDVLFGDVWLCSGQSNMELQVWRSLDARAEIAGASNDRIRVLTVPQIGSASPRADFGAPVRWLATTPETVRDFSATCYYFARELQRRIDVPMGLVVSAWGGSRIQAWTSTGSLRDRAGLAREVEILEAYAADPIAAAARWGGYWGDWWHAHTSVDDSPWTPSADDPGTWRIAPVKLGPWEQWGVEELAAFDGTVWYRSRVELSEEQAAQNAVLELGAADEIDVTWVNGRGVGSEYAPGTPRSYPLPAGVLRAGRNDVVLAVVDTYRNGGLAGPVEAQAIRFGDGSRVVLGPQWEYRIGPDARQSPPRAPWHTASGLSTLFNGMIAPLGRLGLRGAIWYQGESNTFEPERYRQLLETWSADWRAQFGASLPVFIVQLSNYGALPDAPRESGWAGLREAQRLFAESDPHAGLAVTIDLGERDDIHPPNKQALGRRLARVVLDEVYGRSVRARSGPVPREIRRNGDSVTLRFLTESGRLTAFGAARAIGFELCGRGDAGCRYVDAVVSGEQVTLTVPRGFAPVAVRYAWSDSPLVNLFDGNGLPAIPFEHPIPFSADD